MSSCSPPTSTVIRSEPDGFDGLRAELKAIEARLSKQVEELVENFRRIEDAQMTIIRCSQCGTEREAKPTKAGEPRTPRGWKIIVGQVYCQKCKVSLYALRAVSLPVAFCDWEVVRKLHRTATWNVTRLANWLLTQYYTRDALAGDTNDKVPKWTTPYLYPEARVMFPDVEPHTIASVINTVQAKYRAMRFDLWRHKVSLPNFRDLPVPLNRQAWKLRYEDERWIFSFRFSGEWHDLTLRSGREFFRQTRSLSQIDHQNAEPGEAALYARGKSLMMKIAAYFPRETAQGAEVVEARPVADGFLLATSNGGAQWKLNADHVRSWIVGAAKQQQRLREDLKAERRFPGAMRAGIIERMGRLSQRRSNRIDSWVHEASMQLVNWAKRQRAQQLVWDDSARSAMPEQFPWYILGQRIEEKCRFAGIEFVRASDRSGGGNSIAARELKRSTE